MHNFTCFSAAEVAAAERDAEQQLRGLPDRQQLPDVELFLRRRLLQRQRLPNRHHHPELIRCQNAASVQLVRRRLQPDDCALQRRERDDPAAAAAGAGFPCYTQPEPTATASQAEFAERERRCRAANVQRLQSERRAIRGTVINPVVRYFDTASLQCSPRCDQLGQCCSELIPLFGLKEVTVTNL